jgi:hypothetical protein
MFGPRHFRFSHCDLLARHGTAVGARKASVAKDPVPNHTEAIALVAGQGVDVEKLRRRNPSALQYSTTRVLDTIAALAAIHVDPAKALNRWPNLWSVDPGCWEERLAVLRDFDLDVARIVTASPSVLSHLPNTLRSKVAALSRMGLHSAKVVRNCPRALCLHEDRIRRTITFLNDVGLDGVRVVNGYPPILGLTVDAKLRPIVHFVSITMGRDVTELHNHPACFGYSLKGRLIPRYEFAVRHQKQRLPISTLFATTDDRFVKSMGQPIEAYRAFVTEFVCQ